MNEFQRRLDQCLQGKVCLVGVGNVDFGDDGFGVCLAETVRIETGLPVIIAGTQPEVALGSCGRNAPDNLVFLDAVELGAAPGSAVLLDADETVSRLPQISTHKISLGLLAKCVEANCTTKAWLLGVQPASLKAGSGFSPAVQTTLDALSELISASLTQEVAL